MLTRLEKIPIKKKPKNKWIKQQYRLERKLLKNERKVILYVKQLKVKELTIVKQNLELV